MPKQHDPSHFTNDHLDKEKRQFFKEFEKKSEDPLDKYPNPLRPAYPTNNRMFTAAQGLTKREYFAAMAMQGLLSNSHYVKDLEDKFKKGILTDANNMLVRESIDMADELLKELAK